MNRDVLIHQCICPLHGATRGFLSAPVYAGDPRDPRGTGQRWCASCGLQLAQIKAKR